MPAGVYELEIAPQMKDAYVHPMPLPVLRLQARRVGQAEYGTFYGFIQGFKWVEGHHYRLEVEELPRDPFMADGPV